MLPPKPRQEPKELVLHGDRRIDKYFWLREKTNPEVIDYLNQENEFCKQILAQTTGLQEALYREILGRIKEDDTDVPVREGMYEYYSRRETGKEYAIHCRKRIPNGLEEVLLDENQLATGQKYFRLGVYEISPDHNCLAYSVDLDGSEKFTIHFKNLVDQSHYPDQISGAYYSLAWASDNKTVFYTMLDTNERPDRVLRHQLGSDPTQDVQVFKEMDSVLFVSCWRSKDGQRVFISSTGKVTAETHWLNAQAPEDSFQVFAPREHGVLYSVEHHQNGYLIHTNHQATNFKICYAKEGATDKKDWQEVVPHLESIYIESVDEFAEFLVVTEREQGLSHIRVIDWPSRQSYRLDFPEPTYSVTYMGNPEYFSPEFRFAYQSFITPTTIFDYNMKSKTTTQRKQREIPSGHNPNLFKSERLWATSHDGTQVPISLFYRKDTPIDGTAPLLLYGYGSYGHPLSAGFPASSYSLVNRGFVYAMAHVRGGADLGREWYESGKFLKKKNTFFDFIACAEHLIKCNYTNAGEIIIQGGSAGGMLVGTCMNWRPELFKAVVAQVPFVDVLNTMLDDTLPLTTTEYEEWGNPNNPEFYHYIKSYSTYDNVEKKSYPPLFITAGLNDPRVTYWEPAKWLAKLRELKTDQNIAIMKTNMTAGHGGASGRYEAIKEISEVFAFILLVTGRLKTPAKASV